MTTATCFEALWPPSDAVTSVDPWPRASNRPVGSMEPTPVLLRAHVGVTARLVPSEKVAVAE